MAIRAAAGRRRSPAEVAAAVRRLPQRARADVLAPAARIARVAGYRAGAAELARETGTDEGRWKRFHRVYTSVERGARARAWLGLNPYPIRRRRGVPEYADFPAHYDPAPAVGDTMRGTYERIAEARLRELLGE